MSTLKKRFEELGGVASVPDVAEHFGVTDREVRDWASDNCLPRVGNNFAFTLEHAEDFAADLDADEDPCDPDEPDDDEDGEPEEGDGHDDD
jgi:hypothetical protein